MEKLISLIVRSLPTNALLIVNEKSLDELDKRGEIIWTDKVETGRARWQDLFGKIIDLDLNYGVLADILTKAFCAHTSDNEEAIALIKKLRDTP